MGSSDVDVFGAFSGDGGRSFALRTIAARDKIDFYPVTAAWGPDPKGARFAYWTFEEHAQNSDTT